MVRLAAAMIPMTAGEMPASRRICGGGGLPWVGLVVLGRGMRGEAAVVAGVAGAAQVEEGGDRISNKCGSVS